MAMSRDLSLVQLLKGNHLHPARRLLGTLGAGPSSRWVHEVPHADEWTWLVANEEAPDEEVPDNVTTAVG